MIQLEKTANLSSSFVSRHSRESFKDTTISFGFVSLRLYLSKKFPSLIQSFDLADQIAIARQRSQLTEDSLISISSSLTSVSSTPQSSNIFTENPDSITSAESLNMSDFEAELSNQSRSNTASSFDATPESSFSAAQRTEIADIVATAVRAIQMQQLTSSLTGGAQSINQAAEYFKE
jgi:hypothetical protein